MSKYTLIMKADNTIHLIGRIREKANNFIVQELQKLGIKGVVPSHGDILVTLFKHNELTMTDIANRIHRDRSTVTTLVNKLMKFGYIAARKNPEDGRSSIIFLTQKGRELESGFYEISQKLYEVQYKGISDEEKQVLQKLLTKINSNFG